MVDKVTDAEVLYKCKKTRVLYLKHSITAQTKIDWAHFQF